MGKHLNLIFWSSIVVFLFLVAEFFVPSVREYLSGPVLFLIPAFVFFILGILLLVAVLKGGVLETKKKFLLLTGASAAGFFAFVILHNLFYALAEMASSIGLLSSALEVVHAAFFLISVIVCPLGFIVGAIGSIVLLARK